MPVRCYSCGAPAASRHEDFRQRLARGEAPEAALDACGAWRICCRRMLVSQPVAPDQLRAVREAA